MGRLLQLILPLALSIVLGVPALVWAQTGNRLSIFHGTLMEPDQKTEEVSTEELRQLLADGTAVVYDSRAPRAYALGHIPGALNAPTGPGVGGHVAAIQERVVDKGNAIVLYCNGVYWPLSKRLGEALNEAGYTNVRRYQVGLPVWRALVGITEIELDGMRFILEQQQAVVLVDARSPEEFSTRTLPGAKNVRSGEVSQAQADGRLPLNDPNVRIAVFGIDAAQARAVVEELATRGGLMYGGYFTGSADTVLALVP